MTADPADPSSFDVVIVGAGPAGTSAGVAAARAGAQVLILEAEDFPRDKPCGDALTPFAVEQLRKLDVLDVLKGGHVVTGVALLGGRRDLLRMAWPSGGRPSRRTGAVVPRRLLDHHLALAAVQAGAELRTRGRVVELGTDLHRGGIYVTYRASGGEDLRTIKARIAILAAGARSNKLSPAAAATYTHVALRAETESVVRDSRTLQFFTPAAMRLEGFPGYGWIFPMSNDGIINVGIGAFIYHAARRTIDVRSRVAPFREWVLAQSGLRSDTNSLALRGWTIPTNLRPPAGHPGVLLAGDAAGLAHPLTGEGIGPALRSGRIAAAVAVEFLSHGDPVLAARQYRRRIWGSPLSTMAAMRASAPLQWELADRLSSVG